MIDSRFAHITHPNGETFQVLKYNELNEPIDWDEGATREEYEIFLNTGFFRRMWNKITT
jgi:hypothetical protein